MYIFGTLIGLGTVFLLIGFSIWLFMQKSTLIFGIYPCKGLFYQLKYYLALRILHRMRQKLFAPSANQPPTDASLADIDMPQKMSMHPDSYDVASFMGVDDKGQKLKVTMERRRQGVMKTCLYLWLNDRGLFCSPRLPDMISFSTDGQSESREFRGNGFHIYPERCMNIWHLQFKGPLREVNKDELVEVELHLKFSSAQNFFNYNRDLSTSVVADSVAREAWNNEFYNMIKNIDEIVKKRLHFEQIGTLEGQIKVNNDVQQIKMRALRDRSYGTERCLSTINRYVYLSLFLEDGTTMIIGILSQPSFFLSSLKVGYVWKPDGIYEPITGCNFELYTYGERGTPPKHKNFLVETKNKKYFVQIEVEHSFTRYVGNDWQSKVFDQFGLCTVNGFQGQAIGEYLYRNTGGRPKSFSCDDPDWYQQNCLKTIQETNQEGDDNDFDF